MSGASDPEREQALEDYKRSLLELREWEAKLKSLRMGIKDLQHEFDVSEENIKALQSVGQIIGEMLKQLDEERCKSLRVMLGKLDVWHIAADLSQSSSRHHRDRDMWSVAVRRSTRPR